MCFKGLRFCNSCISKDWHEPQPVNVNFVYIGFG